MEGAGVAFFKQRLDGAFCDEIGRFVAIFQVNKAFFAQIGEYIGIGFAPRLEFGECLFEIRRKLINARAQDFAIFKCGVDALAVKNSV